MEQITARKEISILSSSTETKAVEIPTELSREKALTRLNDYEDVHGGRLQAIPSEMATNYLYKMFMKIGATNELPSIERESEMFLNDFWGDLYLRNNLCPGNIPFPIIITEFTTAMVQKKVRRKGNNQEAICEAFNEWICRQEVRDNLYLLRDKMYPEKKPQQVTDGKEKKLCDFSEEELNEQLKKTEHTIKQFKSLKFPKEWKAKLEAEIERRKNGESDA